MEEPSDCVCNDCERFRAHVEGVRELLRHYSGDPRVGRPLVESRRSVKQAWWQWQARRGHVHVSRAPSPDTCQCQFCTTPLNAHDVSDSGDSQEEFFDTASSITCENNEDGNDIEFEHDGDEFRVHGGIDNSDGELRVHRDTDDSESETDDECSDAQSPSLAAESVPQYRGKQAKTCEKGTTDPGHIDNGGQHNKFMVCDHCMSHGLPCNEAAVCDQCQLFGQPCVHRWCSDSIQSKARCSNQNCRYTHKDSISPSTPRWIVLEGRLPRFHSKGRIASRIFENDTSSDDPHDLSINLDRIQENAAEQLESQVLDDLGTLETLHFPCTCQFEARLSTDDNGGTITIPSTQLSDVAIRQINKDNNSDSEYVGRARGHSEYDDRDLDERTAQCPHCDNRNEYYAVYPCEHRICWVCALEARAAKKDIACLLCGSAASRVIFTDDTSKRFAEYLNENFETIDQELGILYETAVIRKDAMWLMEMEWGIRRIAEEHHAVVPAAHHTGVLQPAKDAQLPTSEAATSTTIRTRMLAWGSVALADDLCM